MYNKLLKIINIIRYPFVKTCELINSQVEDYGTGTQYVAFGIFGIINYPAFYIIWLYFSPQAYDSLFLRAIATILSAILILHKYWPKFLKPFLPIYWYITLLYGLPFFFTYMFVKNHGSAMWVMPIAFIVLFLMILIDWMSCIVLLVIGTLLGIWFGYCNSDGPLLGPKFDYVGFLINYFFSVIIGIIFANNKQGLEKEKIQAIKSVGSSIAHELRTPLLAIRAGVSGVKDVVPDLIQSYGTAKQANLAIPEIEPSILNILPEALANAELEAHSANTIINMFLMKINNPDMNPGRFEVYSILNTLDKTISRYPFASDSHKQLVFINRDKDFKFKGIELLIIHVLFNLLKNSLYYIEETGKGNIKIWCELSEKYNSLYFKDSAKGIAKDILPYIFNRFFSKTHNGTGIGLSFCKMVMQGLGGEIMCQSIEGEYTEFVLRFPLQED